MSGMLTRDAFGGMNLEERSFFPYNFFNMDKKEFEALETFRKEYKEKCLEWAALADTLRPLQKEAAKDDTPPYPIETPVVYNTALDSITKDDDIKIIVIGDNPGKDEQLAKNQKYLVGQAGKIAEGFFRRNPGLAIDFRKNALILNKTPVHSAKTKHLKFIASQNAAVSVLVLQSQLWLAQKTAFLAAGLGAQIWLVGYAELKDKGIFVPYRNALKEAATAFKPKNAAVQKSQTDKNADASVYDNLFVFQHFSMNRFLIDLRDFCSSSGDLEADGQFDQASLSQKIAALGRRHRDEIFG